jgi:hypothetical protein
MQAFENQPLLHIGKLLSDLIDEVLSAIAPHCKTGVHLIKESFFFNTHHLRQ